jgi:tetratricopeptide (TPR) repeat protein
MACALSLTLILAGSVTGCAQTQVLGKARSLVYQHREDDAQALLLEHLNKQPSDVEARSLLIRLYGQKSDLPSVHAQIAELRRALPAEDPRADLELGQALELMHRFLEALAAYDEASTRAPRSPAGPKMAGMRAARWGEHEEAQPRLLEAIRRGDRDPQTYHALGLCFMQSSDFEHAREAYQTGAELEEKQALSSRLESRPSAGFANLLGLATVALAERDHARALSAYDRLISKTQLNTGSSLARAYCLARLGRIREAEAELVRAEAMGAPKANIAKIRSLLP